MSERPHLPSIPCDPDDIPRLRLGRRVPQHLYLQRGDEPSEQDEPLFTMPTARLAQLLVDGLEALRWLNINPLSDGVDPDSKETASG